MSAALVGRYFDEDLVRVLRGWDVDRFPPDKGKPRVIGRRKANGSLSGDCQGRRTRTRAVARDRESWKETPSHVTPYVLSTTDPSCLRSLPARAFFSRRCRLHGGLHKLPCLHESDRPAERPVHRGHGEPDDPGG